MKNKVKYILGALFCAVLLFAAGCEDEPAVESPSESSTAVSQASSAAEESVALPDSSDESTESSELEISIDESESEESSEISDEISEESFETSPETSAETSSVPVQRPIYRDEDEPRIEEIVLPDIAEKGFSLTQKELTVELGDRFGIPFAFSPLGTTNKTLKWTTTDPEVIRVAGDGTLTAVGVGVAYVRATTSKGRQSECRVEVVEEIPLSALGMRIEAVASGEYGGLHFALCDVDQDGTQELIVRTTPAAGLPAVDIYEIEVEPADEDPEVSGENSDGSEVTDEISDELAVSEEVEESDTETDVSDEPIGDPAVPRPEGWVLGFETGDNEEWAVWERSDGSRFLLVSFSQNFENGNVHHVMLELSLSEVPEPKEGEEPQEPVLQCVYILTREVHGGTSRYFAQIDGEFTECGKSTYQSVRSAYFSENKQQSGYALTWANGDDPEEIEKMLAELTFAEE